MRQSVCPCPASKDPKACDNVGQLCSLMIQETLAASKALAIVSEVSLGQSSQLKRDESMDESRRSHSQSKIDKEVGLRPKMCPIFAACEHANAVTHISMRTSALKLKATFQNIVVTDKR
jgi:hypothetical protein